MAKAGSYRGVIKLLKSLDDGIPEYFGDLESLITDNYSWDISIGYVFQRLEKAHVMLLYGGLIKRHYVSPNMAWAAVVNHPLFREQFAEMVEIIFDKPMTKQMSQELEAAQKARDHVMHGKSCPEAEKRDSVASGIAYARHLNDFSYKHASFRPCGDLRGVFKGGNCLDDKTSRWVLKGMGFTLR